MERSYLIPGEMPESVRIHFVGSGFPVDERIVILPFVVNGYIASQNESVCGDFRRNSGFQAEDFRQAVETNLPGILLVQTRGGRPIEGLVTRLVSSESAQDIFQRSPYRGVYGFDGKGSERVAGLLDRVSREHHVNIAVMTQGYDCFHEDICIGCRRNGRRQSVEANEARFSDTLAVWIWFCCSGYTKAEPIAKIYDIDLRDRNPFSAMVRNHPLRPANVGTIVYDTNGTPVAEVQSGQIQLLINIEVLVSGFPSDRYWSKNAVVLEKILADAMPIAMQQLRDNPPSISNAEQRLLERDQKYLQERQAIAQSNFFSIMSSQTERLRTRLSSQIRRNREAVAEQQQQLLLAQQELESKLLAIAALDNNLGGMTSELSEQMLSRVREMPKVLGIDTDRTSIKVFTDWIYVIHEGTRYRMGRFVILINFAEKSLQIVTRREQASRLSLEHPHVRGEAPCLGNIQRSVNEMFDEWKFDELTALMIDFLESYNPSNPYQRIENWPSVSIDSD